MNQPQQEFKVVRNFPEYPSKNTVEFYGNEEECKAYLQGSLSISRRNGADVVSADDWEYVCENYDYNGATVKFEIVEA
jgi:hypothetical protein